MSSASSQVDNLAYARSGSAAEARYDPETLIRIKSLELRAKLVVEGFMSGLHRSPHHGFSVEFTDYRQYSPGDDLRYLDWRVVARSDRYYIKRFEDETNLRCYLLMDMSRSMGYGSMGYTKSDYAKTLAATLAYFLSLQRDAVGLLTFDEGIGEFIPARYRPGHLRRLMLTLEKALGGKSTDLALPLEQIAKTVKKRGLVVLISDLLTAVEDLERNLGYLTSQGHEVVVLRILDPAEVHFDFSDSTMFVDLESGRQLYVDPASTRNEYLRRFQEHEIGVHQMCDRLGIVVHRFVVDQPIQHALTEFLNSRLDQNRKIRRRRTAESTAHGGSR